MSLQGYYSAIQYCPDRLRMEAVNIGAILIIPEIEYLKVQMTDSNNRVHRLFQNTSDAFLDELKSSTKNSILNEAAQLKTKEGLDSWGRQLANLVRITPARTCAIRKEPDVEFELLFHALCHDTTITLR